MSADHDTPWVRQYRALCEEPAPTVHDDRILVRAGEVARAALLRRRVLPLALAAAVALCAIGLLQQPPASPIGRTDAGLVEGASREFLLQLTEPAVHAGGLEAR